MIRALRLFGCVLALALIPPPAAAQAIRDVPEDLMREVMPDAERFSEQGLGPTVMEAFSVDAQTGEERLVGYVFHTADVPPERIGYSGPIDAVVGLGLDGRLTGMRITDYRESMRRSRGDFLRPPGFQEQYSDKHIADAFRVFEDVESISRATISVRAVSRGIRDASRRVADAYITRADDRTSVVEDVYALTWLELRQTGIAQLLVVESDIGPAEISLVHVVDEAFGERLVGAEAMQRATAALDSVGGGHLFVYGLDGPRLQYFSHAGWSVVQGAFTISIPPNQVLASRSASDGILAGQVSRSGAMILDASIDLAKPFEIRFDLRPQLGLFAVDYLTLEARQVLAGNVLAAGSPAAVEAEADAPSPGTPTAPPASDAAASEPGPSIAASTERSGMREAPVPSTPSLLLSPDQPPDRPPDQNANALDLVYAEDETLLARAFSGTTGLRLAAMSVVLLLAMLAFLQKKPSVRALSLALTLVYLGFIDGGFLSVSHLTSGIWRGPSVYFDDPALLLMVSFTVIVTLLWGRVFCGFLCPFGALQDLLDKVVPSRFRVRVPARAHERGLWVKYVILAGILIPAIAGSQVSLYQYVEPFGTVFFPSTSVLLWAIALAFLAASAVVPRFYCRYVCPLGAALAIGSLAALKRIRRVEQCALCKVCEKSCPTGAIQLEKIDFKECVRCNVCETKLIQTAGVCRHDMDEVRSRLSQLETWRGVEVSRD